MLADKQAEIVTDGWSIADNLSDSNWDFNTLTRRSWKLSFHSIVFFLVDVSSSVDLKIK